MILATSKATDGMIAIWSNKPNLSQPTELGRDGDGVLPLLEAGRTGPVNHHIRFFLPTVR